MKTESIIQDYKDKLKTLKQSCDKDLKELYELAENSTDKNEVKQYIEKMNSVSSNFKIEINKHLKKTLTLLESEKNNEQQDEINTLLSSINS